MSGPDENDATLMALLAPPDRAPDRAFVIEVNALVQLDQAYRRRRRLAWSRFAGEAASAAGLSGAAVTLTVAGGGTLTLIAGLIPLVWIASNRWIRAR